MTAERHTPASQTSLIMAAMSLEFMDEHFPTISIYFTEHALDASGVHMESSPEIVEFIGVPLHVAFASMAAERHAPASQKSLVLEAMSLELMDEQFPATAFHLTEQQPGRQAMGRQGSMREGPEEEDPSLTKKTKYLTAHA
eukprot:CAMPEP_0115052346 /NCGR_PEP_ID=MMETSP0227-20121206/2880_1 /TAXON_ID=89957 /ORGANISM="Polarella glacialis, Strain CCMP 1383" /LENGTH=140 /DNA_ID=CAMNT_0002436485 /DNA_START=766 /DNA_END=1185 /DNA_ORIENTATION=-